MSEIKTAWHWWWGWNPEKIENWLEGMENDGWNLSKIDFNYLRFKFEKGEARKVRYCVDYQNKVDDNYFEILKEDGWELVGNKYIPWYMWRKSYENERPNIYTDAKSLMERNNRLLITVGIFLLLEISIFSQMFLHGFDEMGLVSLMFIMIIAFIGYITVQLYRYNKRLARNEIRL
ncbi:MAG: DUF2812 domain-containing protein [Methanobacterium sp.]